jgi:pheromone a factor receptor
LEQTGVLSYRLYRYRREFVRLISARNTTKSRFIRLFTICIIIILIYVPYTFYLLATLVKSVINPYDWARVHDPTRFNSIIKVPAYGTVTLDRWAQVITGYIVFFVFGTGNDAHNTYKAMLLAVGLGRVSPSLHLRHESGSASPASFSPPPTWASTISRKAKNIFSSITTGSSVTDTTLGGTTRNNSVVLASMCHLRPASIEETMLKTHSPSQSPTQASWFTRLLNRHDRRGSILPLYSHGSATELTDTSTHKSSASDSPPAFKATAWAGTSGLARVTEAGGVRVFREVHQDHEDRDVAAKENTLGEDWA